MNKNIQKLLIGLSILLWIIIVYVVLELAVFKEQAWEPIVTYTVKNNPIVYDEENWLITIYSEDLSYGITIQDRNLWADSVWEIGNHYQWWNNHWNNFENHEEVLDVKIEYNETYDNNGYDWEEIRFIRGDLFDDSTNQDYWTDKQSYDNLRWGWDDSEGWWYNFDNHQTTNLSWRQWPCPKWFHVPSKWEWDILLQLRCESKSDCLEAIHNDSLFKYENEDIAQYISKFWIKVSSGTALWFIEDFKLPLWRPADKIYWYSMFPTEWEFASFWQYWTSTPNPQSHTAYSIRIFDDSILSSMKSERWMWFNIRCFKD